MFACLVIGCSPALARDAFVLLSGGNSPFDNNYSQYLQARAVADFFEHNYPPDSVWIFFGAGNVRGEKPILADVCQETQKGDFVIPSWLPGSLPHNLPARRSVFLAALRNEILPAITNGDTLFLFVGDHGSRSRGRNQQSEIDLWSLGRDPASEHGWRESDDEVLPVSELRSVLTNGIGKGRVVFCMTQCHAGGFHYLAIPHEMRANPNWFTEVPVWAMETNETIFPNVAGFTATDEYSMASGCDPDPNPAHWEGYERYFPEHLLGVNLFTLEPKRKSLPSFAEAHIAATLEDATIDKPASTSEQFLERWANLIDKRLANDTHLTAKVRSAVTAYQTSVNGNAPKVADEAFKERQKQFRKFIDQLAGVDADLKQMLMTGSRKDLEEIVHAAEEPPPREPATNGPANPPRPRGRGQFGGRRRLYRETIRPAWKAAVEANQITNLSPAALEFEKHLLNLEDDGKNFFNANALRDVEEEVYWESGFNDPLKVNFSRADAITLWGMQRHDAILNWAKASHDTNVVSAAKRLSQTPGRRGADAMPAEHDHGATPVADMGTAAERTLFYRRVLAAWEFLIAVNEKPALDRLRELTQLERTPLPMPRR